MMDVDWTWTIMRKCPGCNKDVNCPRCASFPIGGLVTCARIPFHNNCPVGEKGVKEYDSDDPRCM